MQDLKDHPSYAETFTPSQAMACVWGTVKHLTPSKRGDHRNIVYHSEPAETQRAFSKLASWRAPVRVALTQCLWVFHR